MLALVNCQDHAQTFPVVYYQKYRTLLILYFPFQQLSQRLVDLLTSRVIMGTVLMLFLNATRKMTVVITAMRKTALSVSVTLLTRALRKNGKQKKERGLVRGTKERSFARLPTPRFSLFFLRHFLRCSGTSWTPEKGLTVSGILTPV